MMNILFVSLGCDKNLVDSEVMLGLLSNKGYTFTDDETEADVIVVNTCCFIGDAKEESVNTILEMAEYRKAGKCKALIVTGCLAQRYKQEISFEKAEDMVGKSLWCMIEGKVADEYAYVARTYKDAPGVDGYLFVQTLEELMSGDFVKVKVTGADDYDLIGEIDDESAE